MKRLGFLSLLLLICAGLSVPASAGEIGGVVLVPLTLPQGNDVSVTVTTIDLDTQSPVSAPATVLLVADNGDTVLELFNGTTDEQGIATISFTVPTTSSGAHTITVETGGGSFSAAVTIIKGPAVLIETDKPLYQPGQTIQGRVLLVNNEMKPATGTCELTIKDAKGIRIDRRTLETNPFGAAAFSLPLADSLNMGTWKITAESGSSSTELAVKVEKYVLPQFSIDVDFPKSWFLPEEEIPVDITSSYFFGKQVQGTVQVTASRYSGVWEEYASITKEVIDGACSLTLPPVEYAAGVHESQGDSAVTIDITVTDTSSHTEATNRILTIASAPVEVQLIARERFLKPELPFSFLVLTETPSGVPQDRDVELLVTFNDEEGVLDEFTETISTSEGQAVVTYTVPAKALSCNLTATLEEEGHTSEHSLNLYASHSPSASFLHLSRTGEENLNVGDTAQFTATTTFNGTIFWEVLRAGKVLLNGASREKTFDFTVNSAMIPRIDIVAYTLNPGNELACDTIQAHVALAASVDLSAGFSTPRARPGEEVTLSFQAPRRSLLGISIVDESLLALAEEQLTLKSVFDKLEACFMEPRVEVHFDMQPDPWSPVTIPGTREMLLDAGLSVGSSPGITVPEGTEAPAWLGWGRGGEWGFWEDAELDGNVPAAPGENQSGGSSALAEVERIRQFFPETWVWEPLFLTDENGSATLTLTCPDSITSWHMKAFSSSSAGMGMTEEAITVFQEFFVNPDLPVEVVRGEVFPLKLQVYNYAEQEQTILLELQQDGWFELEDPASGSVSVGPNEVTSMEIRIKPVQIGSFPLNITARGQLYADAVKKNLTVIPEGVTFTTVENGIIHDGEEVSFAISYPPETVPDSGYTHVSITPSLIAQSLGGLEDLIGMPYGCGEQNMMFFAPDIQVLRYLLITGENYPEIWAEAEHFANVGYQRQLTYRRSDGSFSAFGENDENGSLYLTSFVLSCFAAATDVKDIDETVLAEAASWLVSHQAENGSWEPFGFLHHNELKGGMDGTYSLTAFTAKALAEYDPESMQAALTKACAFLSENRSTVSDQPYPLAVSAYALSLIPGVEDDAEAAIELLLPLAQSDKNGIYWEPYPIETTAYAALALIKRNKPQAQDAINYLVSNRSALGGFGSTQDTVMAFQAIIEAAVKASRDVNASIELYVDDAPVTTFTVDQQNYDLLQKVKLPEGTSGSLVMTGTGAIGYQVARTYNLPVTEAPPPQNMLISVEYKTEHIAVDDIVDVEVALTYTGMREKTNMVIADVGVPTGFSVVQASLDALIEEGTVSRTETAIRKAIFYISELTRDETVRFTFQVRALFPIKAAAVTSKAYDYYQPEDQGLDQGSPVTVGNALFLRGDANRDAAIDLSDAVTILQYLFSQGKLTCLDAADVNDDGMINIADPVGILHYLFAGGAHPAEPWEEAGTDPTTDNMGCAQ